MDSQRFEIYNAYLDSKGPIILDYNTKNCAVDYTPLFENAFNHHQEKFGSPDYLRIEKNGNNNTIKFSLVDLVEAFCVNYSPEDLMGFFKEKTDADCPQSAALISRLNKVRDKLPMTYAKYWRQHNAKYRIGAINFSMSNLDMLIRGKLLGRHINFNTPYKTTDTRKWYGKLQTRIVHGRNITDEIIVKELKSAMPGKAFLFANGIEPNLPPTLHDIHIASHYNQDLSNLEVIKKLMQ